MPLTPGLVSVSVRQLAPDRVVALAVEAGLKAIEWGGDMHCPHGDVARAAEVARLTRAAGLDVAAYGSYYRLGVSEAQGLHFPDVVASARALGAPRIRVWAGAHGAAETSAAERALIVAEARRCADLAAEAGIRVVSEWHGGTLTDSFVSGRALLAEVGHPAFLTAWQPPIGFDADAALAELEGIMPWVDHLHVFHWHGYDRLPLAQGADCWRRYLACAAASGRPLTAALEFVLADDPAQLMADSATLRSLIATSCQPSSANHTS